MCTGIISVIAASVIAFFALKGVDYGKPITFNQQKYAGLKSARLLPLHHKMK